MTIDEFMRDIAPKMRSGWVAMDYDGAWYWFLSKPSEDMGIWGSKNNYYSRLCCYNIAPVDDWKKSLRKVGKWMECNNA